MIPGPISDSTAAPTLILVLIGIAVVGYFGMGLFLSRRRARAHTKVSDERLRGPPLGPAASGTE